MKNDDIHYVLLNHIRSDLSTLLSPIMSRDEVSVYVKDTVANNIYTCTAFIKLNLLEKYITLSKLNYTSEMLRSLINKDYNDLDINIDTDKIYVSVTPGHIKVKWENLNIPELVQFQLNEVD